MSGWCDLRQESLPGDLWGCAWRACNDAWEKQEHVILLICNNAAAPRFAHTLFLSKKSIIWMSAVNRMRGIACKRRPKEVMMMALMIMVRGTMIAGVMMKMVVGGGRDADDNDKNGGLGK